MVDDKLVSRSFWVGDIQHVRIVPTIFIFIYKNFYKKKIIIKIEKIIERTKRVSKYIRLNIIENHNFYNKIIFQN